MLVEDTLKKVQKLASFRKEAKKPFYLSIIYSSIDQLDISYILKNIPSILLRELQVILYQLLKYTIDSKGYTILQNIEKALYFINSYELVNKAIKQFCQQLVNITKNIQNPSKKYIIIGTNSSYNICNIVLFYTSRVASND